MNIDDFLDSVRATKNIGGTLEAAVVDGDGPRCLVARWDARIRGEPVFFCVKFDAIELSRVPLKQLGERFAYSVAESIEKRIREQENK